MLDDTPKNPRYLQDGFFFDGTIDCLKRMLDVARADCGETGARNIARLVSRHGHNYTDAARQYAADYLKRS